MLCFLRLLTLGVLAQSDQLAWPQLHPEWQRDGKHASQAALVLLSFEAFQGARPSGTHSRKHSTQVGGTGDHGFVASLGYIARSLPQNKWDSLRRIHSCSLADTKKDGHNGREPLLTGIPTSPALPQSHKQSLEVHQDQSPLLRAKA